MWCKIWCLLVQPSSYSILYIRFPNIKDKHYICKVRVPILFPRIISIQRPLEEHETEPIWTQKNFFFLKFHIPLVWAASMSGSYCLPIDLSNSGAIPESHSWKPTTHTSQSYPSPEIGAAVPKMCVLHLVEVSGVGGWVGEADWETSDVQLPCAFPSAFLLNFTQPHSCSNHRSHLQPL